MRLLGSGFSYVFGLGLRALGFEGFGLGPLVLRIPIKVAVRVLSGGQCTGIYFIS